MKLLKTSLILSVALLAACSATDSEDAKETNSFILPTAFPSTYEPLPSETVLITNAVIIDGTGEASEANSILLSEGKIVEVGIDLSSNDANILQRNQSD